MKDALAAIMLVFGACICLIAAIGILRLPDFYSRLQASTKAQTLGMLSILLGFAVAFEEIGAATRAIVLLFFVFVTAPVAGHMIARAAYLLGVPLWEGTCIDELAGRYDPETHSLLGIHEDRVPTQSE
jgi:multicomponent Na+:H+ antiporter subunit G